MAKKNLVPSYTVNQIVNVTLSDVGLISEINTGREDVDSYGSPANDLAQSLMSGWNATLGVARALDVTNGLPLFDRYVPVFGRVAVTPTVAELRQRALKRVDDIEATAQRVTVEHDGEPIVLEPAAVAKLGRTIYANANPRLWIVSGQRRTDALLWAIHAAIELGFIKDWSEYKIPVYVAPFEGYDALQREQLIDNTTEGKRNYSDASLLSNAVTVLRDSPTIKESELARICGFNRGATQKYFRWAKIETKFTHVTPQDGDLRLVDRCLMRPNHLKDGKTLTDLKFFTKEGKAIYKPLTGPLSVSKLDKEEAACLLNGTDNDSKGGGYTRDVRGNGAKGLASQDEVEKVLGALHGFGTFDKPAEQSKFDSKKLGELAETADWKDAPVMLNDLKDVAAGKKKMSDVKPAAIGPQQLRKIADSLGNVTAPVKDVINAILALDIAFFDKLNSNDAKPAPQAAQRKRRK